MHAIQATFQNGVFTPAEPVKLPDGLRITLWLDPAAKEFTCLRNEDRTFLDQLAKRRTEVFRRLAE